MEAIGIDLGTTYTVCAVLTAEGQVQVIQNELGEYTTPSWVAFVGEEKRVGKVAQVHVDVDPRNQLYDVKRLIGRKFQDPSIQKDIQEWPFQVRADEEDNPLIQVDGKDYHPEQISAIILHSVKTFAQEFIGKNRETLDAVITVPAYFNDGQRQATRDAGTMAGLNVLRIVNEPTAAAVAYCYKTPPETKKNLLVFDLGGGTFDVSILTMHHLEIRVLAVGGDAHLGGEDFDQEMIRFCVQQFQDQQGIQLPGSDPAASEGERRAYLNQMRRLKMACEEKKRHLSLTRSVLVAIDAFHKEIDLKVTFTQQLFEELNEEKFRKCITVMDQVVQDSKLKKEDIDKILFVGGSSRIPRIQALVKEYFPGKILDKTAKLDEIVAEGAAIVAAQQLPGLDLGRSVSRVPPKVGFLQEKRTLDIIDVVPHSIGVQVEVARGATENFFEMIPKNTPVPCDYNQTFGVPFEGAYYVMVTIFQGESKNVENNFKLGEFRLKLPPNCDEDEQVQVTISVNEDGIVHVTATLPSQGETKEMRIEELKGRLGKERIRQLRIKS